jgi:hypothetical protein
MLPLVVEISSLDPLKSTLNIFPLTVASRLTFVKRFANASRSSITTLRYSNKRAFLVLFTCFVYSIK